MLLLNKPVDGEIIYSYFMPPDLKIEIYLNDNSSLTTGPNSNNFTNTFLIITLVNVNALVVATTSWWLHFSAQVVA